MGDEKMVKWTARELFDSFKTETNVNEFKELYKALLAREIGLDEYTDNADALMTEVLEDEYYDNANISSFIDMDLVSATHEAFKDADFEVDDWY